MTEEQTQLSFADTIEDFRKAPLYISFTPEVLDFTIKRTGNLIVSSKEAKITLGINKKNIGIFLYCVDKNYIISWKIKNFFSYVLGVTGRSLNIEAPILDLFVIESYFGINKKAPENFDEAFQRLSFVRQLPGWKEFFNIYNRIFIKLIKNVIPEIETIGVIDKRLKCRLFPYYEINGQANGRMKCEKVYEYSFNPHSISAEDKPAIRPPILDYEFLYFDYKSMEVMLLQWMSKDEELGKIISSGEDMYSSIWKKITGLECNDKFREKCKDMFLPVVYGQGIKSLAERNKWSEETAKKIIGGIYKVFPTAMTWVKEQQDKINSDGIYVDRWGRSRKFEDDEKYLVRNFVVQAPASLYCLDKLVSLRSVIKDRAKMAFHVHDGYYVYCHKNEKKRVTELSIKCLESESEMFPGLKMKVSVRSGETL